MKFFSLLGLFVAFAIVGGCSSAPIKKSFVSPDSPESVYSLSKGELLKTQKPDERTMAVTVNSIGKDGPFSIIDFTRDGLNGSREIPPDHMIAVQAIDPAADNHRLLIPVQYVSQIDWQPEYWRVYHTVPAIESPLKIDDSYQKTKSSRGKTSYFLRNYTPDGRFKGMISMAKVITNPTLTTEEIDSGALTDIEIIAKQGVGSYQFLHGKDYQQAISKAKEDYLEGQALLKKRQKRIKEIEKAQDRLVEQALSAPTPIGTQVCTLKARIGVVEKEVDSRIKVRLIGKAKVWEGREEKFLFDTFNAESQFGIDTRNKGMIEWWDSDDAGICNDIDINQ